MTRVDTVTGPADSAELGLTLMHEHLLIGYPGWWLDTRAPKFQRAEAMARAVDTLQTLRDRGVRTFVDPCPMDLGRDVTFMAEAAQRSGMRIVCTTGMYTERDGIPYTFRAMPVEEIAAIYIGELTEGIADTGIRAGLIKLATGTPISAYEKKLCAAAGMASQATGCPVITHTERASHGLEQLELLAAQGVPPHRVLVGHSDGRADHAYHASLAERGAYVGFDRFGIEVILPDAERIESVLALLRAGHVRSLCVSHDATCGAWLGRPVFDARYLLTPEQVSARLPKSRPTHLFDTILPELRARGVSEADLNTILVENPRRYFEGAERP
jgi:phosphotriesterase-related protein